MRNRQYFKNRVFELPTNGEGFESLALELFLYQAQNNKTYADYLQALSIRTEEVNRLSDIPFLPISSFKTSEVRSGVLEPEVIFSSSGTGGSGQSRHLVAELEVYEESFRRGFEYFYGSATDLCILALLPSYLEREGSSLIYMAEDLIARSRDEDSGFYLNELDELHKILLKKIASSKPTLLLGVSFALLDLAETYSLPENDLLIMETGGMKGRRKEMIRAELHEALKGPLGVRGVHSEYGMTELLSQAYSQQGGLFNTPPWMKVQIRRVDDPFSLAAPGKTGGINVVDLANIDSCAFVETQDLGRLHEDGSFEVMGRFDHADIRGCNLMVI